MSDTRKKLPHGFGYLPYASEDDGYGLFPKKKSPLEMPESKRADKKPVFKKSEHKAPFKTKSTVLETVRDEKDPLPRETKSIPETKSISLEKKIIKDSVKWEGFTDDEKEANKDKFITYSFSAGYNRLFNTGFYNGIVSKETQIELDEQLARKLQAELNKKSPR